MPVNAPVINTTGVLMARSFEEMPVRSFGGPFPLTGATESFAPGQYQFAV
jgi:hypothetical protein